MRATGDLTDRDYRALARFRHALRVFLRFSEDTARDEGLSPNQHQLLLAVRGHGDGLPTIGQVADLLQLRHHSVVELVDRAADAGVLRRVVDPDDRRRQRLALTPAGRAKLARLTAAHRDELRRFRREMNDVLLELADPPSFWCADWSPWRPIRTPEPRGGAGLLQHIDKSVAVWHPANVAVLALPTLVTGIPAPPPPSLDPIIDAAARCFARHGIRRTSVQDIGAELRVNRTTVYRQVGNVDAIVRLLLARELHRLLESLSAVWNIRRGPETIVELLSTVVDFARSHPVAVKVIADEPELIGPFLVSDLADVVGRVAAGIAPLLRAGMDSGHLARRDPVVVAEWLVRLGVSLILAPPPGEVASFLAELLVPALEP